MPTPRPLITRHSIQASREREAGHFATADTCTNAADNTWASHALTHGLAILTAGALALLCEHAPQQWQRDAAHVAWACTICVHVVKIER